MKVTELARELSMHPKELIKLLGDNRVRVKSGNAKLNPQIVAQAKKWVAGSHENREEVVIEGERFIVMPRQKWTVDTLSKSLGLPLSEIMRYILLKGMTATINSEIDESFAIEMAKKFNITLEFEGEGEKDPNASIKDRIAAMDAADDVPVGDMVERPPVITVMGHVDHGKTLLLDAIRKANVVDKEAGGITQHIGAYQVELNHKRLTFLDTPGHAAFTALRARGAQLTDVAVLVVAADDGVMPQTIEAIDHAKAAKVPIIVAINKVDKPEANIDRIKQQLADHDLLAEDWGGQVPMVQVSAKAKTGIQELLEVILIQAELLELKALETGNARAVVIESRLSRQKGPVATVLVQSGQLNVGSHFVVGISYSKVRALLNENGSKVDHVKPGSPAEIMGLAEVPRPGEVLQVFDTEKECKAVIDKRLQDPEFSGHARGGATLQSLAKQIEEGDITQLNVLVKADVHGSLEAVITSIRGIPQTKVTVNVLHSGTGTINESDIMLAKASNAIIFGFGVSINLEAQKVADEENVQVRTYRIIYEIIEDIEKAIDGLFAPEFEDVETATVEVRQLFSFSKVGSIAGCYVTEGKITRSDHIRVLRANEEIFKGKLDSLKRFKDDVKEVASGFECGIVVDDFDGIKEGDIIKSFVVREKGRR